MVHAIADEAPAPTPAPAPTTNPGPSKIWSVKDPVFEGIRPVDKQGYKQSSAETAIVIDIGMYQLLTIVLLYDRCIHVRPRLF